MPCIFGIFDGKRKFLLHIITFWIIILKFSIISLIILPHTVLDKENNVSNSVHISIYLSVTSLISYI